MRPGIDGNPFVIGADGSRDEVLSKHEDYIFLAIRHNGADLERLRGKDLVCCCKPKRCHGDILFVLANTDIF